jgi:hypothetical protein
LSREFYSVSFKNLYKILFFLFCGCLFISCEKEKVKPPLCPSGDCIANLILPSTPDQNGFYHMKLDWTRDFYPYFFVDIQASPTSPSYRYNELSVVTANFDSDTYWVIGENLVVQQSYYQPFSPETTYTNSSILPSQVTNLVLNQFAGIKVNVAPPTTVYFKHKGNIMVSRQGIGPFPPEMIGDTITLYMKVYWDGGSKSELRDDYSKKFIVE